MNPRQVKIRINNLSFGEGGGRLDVLFENLNIRLSNRKPSDESSAKDGFFFVVVD
jgi:hypothetical protein